MKILVTVRGDAEHDLAGKTLIATTDHAASSYGMPVIIGLDKQPIGPADLLVGAYLPVPLGTVTVIYPVGSDGEHTDDTAAAIEALRRAGYTVANTPPCTYASS